MTGWQTIDSAPRNGTEVLLFLPYAKQIIIAAWRMNDQEIRPNWTVEDLTSVAEKHEEPSHWQPLPPPPTEETTR